ncbi:ABC transporter permease [Haliovirga abyssi]|uniref:ABC transporter n=1 Tax=Haliovirga abyssi TaxID=2996794 RepID=A0AAU9D2J9_9FUSO|nr:ABC transporter permease subunit [Haliovirga abyssi]BDU50224.1 ABC transporter [Haliovirga abyssi]
MKKKSFSINMIVLIIWTIPFIFFLKDFFKVSELIKLFNYKLLKILYYTVLQSAISTVGAFVISLAPAYFFSKKENLLSKLLGSTIVIPFFFPVVSAIVSFSIIFSFPLLKKIGLMYSFWAIIIVHIFYNSPIYVKYLGEGLKKIPRNIIEEAEIIGAKKRDIFFKIELPILASAILKATFLVFTYCFMSFAVVLALGGIKYSTFEVAIVTSLMGEFNFSKAFIYAFIQFLFLFLFNSLLNRVGNENYELGMENKKEKKINVIILIISIFYLMFEFGVIIISVIYSFYDFFNSRFDFSAVNRVFFGDISKKFRVYSSFWNSISISFFVAFIVVIFVYLILKNKNKFISKFVVAAISISPAFLAMALLYMNILFDINFFILLFWGYLLITVPIGYSFLYQHITGFDKEIIEAAKLDGATNFKMFYYIEAPILFPVFIGTFLQLFAIIYGEFTLAYAMQVQEYVPLVSILNYSLSSRRLFKESAVISAVNIVIILSIFVISEMMISGEKKSRKEK